MPMGYCCVQYICEPLAPTPCSPKLAAVWQKADFLLLHVAKRPKACLPNTAKIELPVSHATKMRIQGVGLDEKRFIWKHWGTSGKGRG